ncbi:hypothetical protein JX266_013412 [Neoarthrinium moseri]|nr:hypothetical protein JX266_013412 [Neoarthrinium moseri]
MEDDSLIPRIDPVFAEMNKNLGKPPLIVDLRPINSPMVLVTSHEIAELLAKPSSLFPTSAPKTSLDDFHHVIGTRSILAPVGENWKALRKIFNPGFSLQHLFTLLPAREGKTSLFRDHPERHARTENVFPIQPLVVNLTFDVIGAVVML